MKRLRETCDGVELTEKVAIPYNDGSVPRMRGSTAVIAVIAGIHCGDCSDCGD